MTQNFYKTTIKKTIDELLKSKENFLKSLKNDFPYQNEYGKIRFMTKNHPFAIYTTNKENVSMFNNGTYHFNFTLPTILSNGKIADKEKFINDHKKAIRVLQLFSPILLCIFGSPDPFSKINDTFSACSQRCSVSRYIGVGTYDTEKMTTGKLLTVPLDKLELSELPYWWFNRFHSCSSYEKIKDIGMDINFNKHHFHGIELRIFDYFPEEQLEGLLTFIIHLFDLVYYKEEIQNYVLTEQWNNMTEKCIRYGIETELSSSDLFIIEDLLEKPILSSKVKNVYNEIHQYLSDKYKKDGPVSSYMMKEIKDDKKEKNEENEEKEEKEENKRWEEKEEKKDEKDVVKNCCIIS